MIFVFRTKKRHSSCKDWVLMSQKPGSSACASICTKEPSDSDVIVQNPLSENKKNSTPGNQESTHGKETEKSSSEVKRKVRGKRLRSQGAAREILKFTSDSSSCEEPQSSASKRQKFQKGARGKVSTGRSLKADYLTDFFPECSRPTGSHLTRSYIRKQQEEQRVPPAEETTDSEPEQNPRRTGRKTDRKGISKKKKTTGNQQSRVGRRKTSGATAAAAGTRRKQLLEEPRGSREDRTAGQAEEKADTTGTCSSSRSVCGN